MGVALWESLLDRPATPASLIDDLYAMELQRIALNMQISLLHTLGRQAQECPAKPRRPKRLICGVSMGMPRPFHPPPRSHHEHALRRRGQHRFCAGLPRIPQHGNDEPRRLLRLNVYFDNPIPKKDGEFEDRGGFWAPVELWHRDADHWKDLYQKGMRVLVEGRTVKDEGRTPTTTSARRSRSRPGAWASCRTASSR